jgi:hypothetical protein
VAKAGEQALKRASSTLKHCFGMQRALYKGEIGFERHVGWCIIAHNLVAMSRAGAALVDKAIVNQQRPSFDRPAATAQTDQATGPRGHLRILI